MKEMRLKHIKVKEYLNSREYDDLDVKVKEVASLGYTEATQRQFHFCQPLTSRVRAHQFHSIYYMDSMQGLPGRTP